VLHSLHLENFTIVEQIELELQNGLTIITGETGAGKSILINALSLVLGERADTTLIRQGCETAQVKATFILPAHVQTWLQQLKLTQQNHCLVRRVINSNGRSRGYINEQPVSIQLLRQLGEHLIDIHGQHAHQSLLKPEVQRQLLDEVATDTAPLAQVKQAYQHWKSLQTALDNLGGEDRETKITFLRYQLQELAPYELTDTALKQLEADHRRLANIHKLLEKTQHVLALLDSGENNSSLHRISQASRILTDLQQHDSKLHNTTVLLNNALIQTQEAVADLHDYLQQLDLEPTRLTDIQQQLIHLQDLARKHRVNFHELPQHFSQLQDQLQQLENYEEHVNRLQTEIAHALINYRQAAETLHQQRQQNAQALADQVTEEIQKLGMPGGQLTIAITADEEAPPSANGTDIIEFLVTANPGHPPKPLHKIASGGELSRISLAIQVIAAQKNGVPILVFDEVDVGIGGGVAEIVGQLLKHLGQQRQVLCITHLPQVACQAHHHLQVSKIIKQQTTHTAIKILDDNQKIMEIARMLGGLEMTPQTLAHAQEMLQNTQAQSALGIQSVTGLQSAALSVAKTT